MNFIKMSSFVKLAQVSKKNGRLLQIIQRQISTSKKNQEVCVTNAEINEQEPVIFLNKYYTKFTLFVLIFKRRINYVL